MKKNKLIKGSMIALIIGLVAIFVVYMSMIVVSFFYQTDFLDRLWVALSNLCIVDILVSLAMFILGVFQK